MNAQQKMFRTMITPSDSTVSIFRSWLVLKNCFISKSKSQCLESGTKPTTKAINLSQHLPNNWLVFWQEDSTLTGNGINRQIPWSSAEEEKIPEKFHTPDDDNYLQFALQ